MASGIAHEINNPLAILQSSMYLINKTMDKAPLDDKLIRSLTTKSIEVINRIANIIKSLRQLAVTSKNEPILDFDLTILLDQIQNLCSERIKTEEVEFKIPDLKGTYISIHGRQAEILQSLLSLIYIALDAVKNSSSKWIEIDFSSKDNFVFIDVSDSGPGVDESIRSKIMEPFFTTKEVNKGMGLGLSITSTILQSQNGSVEFLENKKITTFRIKIPGSIIKADLA